MPKKSKQGTPRRLRSKRRPIAKTEGMTSTGVEVTDKMDEISIPTGTITPFIGQKRPLRLE